MEIIQSIEGNKMTIALKGRLDTNTSSELDAAIRVMDTSVDSLVLDLAGLEYVSSAGLRVILSTHKMMSKHGGMTVINVGDVVMEVLEATGFVDVINIV